MRYADPKGDLGRIERQRQYIALMVDQMLSWQTVVNPFRQWAIVNAMLDSVRVDDGTGLINLGTFGFGMGRIASGSGEVTTVPIDDTDHWENGQWVMRIGTPRRRVSCSPRWAGRPRSRHPTSRSAACRQWRRAEAPGVVAAPDGSLHGWVTCAGRP